MAVTERTNRVAEKTKGQLEAEISEAMMQFQREQKGRGPTRRRPTSWAT